MRWIQQHAPDFQTVMVAMEATGHYWLDLVELRQLSRFRFRLVDSISDVKRQVIGILNMVFPEYETLFSLFGATTFRIGRCHYPAFRHV